jgi:hypothetical protein
LLIIILPFQLLEEEVGEVEGVLGVQVVAVDRAVLAVAGLGKVRSKKR